MKTLKKVWRYIAKYKKLLTISILSMLIVQALGLVAPLIVKSILDDYLIGIERPWYETLETADAVYYNDKYYTQEKNSDIPYSIFIYQGKYYFFQGEINNGYREVVYENDSYFLHMDKEGETLIIPVDLLSKSEVKSFYNPFIKPLTILIILLFVRFLLQILFTYIQRITTSKININIVRDARKDAVRALQNLPMTYFESEPAGKIANRVIHDVGGMMNLFSTLMNLLLNASLSVIFAYIGMFYLDVKLALLTFIVFPIIYFWLKVFISRLNKIAVKVNEQNSLITAQLNEIINGISILQIFNFRKQTAKNFNQLSQDFNDNKMREVKLHITLGWNLIRLVGSSVTALIVLYFGNGYLTIAGFVVTAGVIYAYNDYLSRLVEPVSVLFREFSNLQHAIVKTERIFTVIDGKQEDPSNYEIERFKGDIKFDNIWFSYIEGKPVLKGIDLHIKPGEMVGIVGHTGSGKSTMMSLLLRFYDLESHDLGNIYVDDIDVKTYSKRSYRKHIGIILQDPTIFTGTIADNIRFDKDDVTDEKIEEVLRSIGASKMIDKLPLGVKQPLSRGGSNLSVGEKQLISFARAVIHDPAILIMDEATANIDTETETMIQTALDEVKKNRTTIVIAHRLSTIKNADKIVVLESGIKVEEGKHQELLEKNGVYSNIYRSQIKTIAE